LHAFGPRHGDSGVGQQCVHLGRGAEGVGFQRGDLRRSPAEAR
jgi:hypothetical protein